MHYINYSSLPVEMQLVKVMKEGQNRFNLLNPLTHLARRSTNRTFFWKTMISDYFLSERPISQPKTQ